MSILRKYYLILFSALGMAVLIAACFKKQELVINGPGPSPVLPSLPLDYGFGNNHIPALGRVLFYDRNLSLNNAISCGSCHKQAFAFSDNHQFSRGLNNGMTSRNASALLGSHGHQKFWDGRAKDMSDAVFMPVMNKVEMSIFDLNLLPGKLSGIPYYPALFDSAYGTPEINIARIRQALATFVGCFTSNKSKWDLSWSGPPLSPLEKQGETIFEGKAGCYQCHNGQDFNGYSTSYEDIGLDANYADLGRGNITKYPEDDGKFAVPTLRNIELTAPYMHDGRYKTLREVIDHYDKGIQNSRNLSWMLRDFITDSTTVIPSNINSFPPVRLNLTEGEKRALEAFLKSLTDVHFITDPRLSDPF